MDINNIDDRWNRIGEIIRTHGSENDKIAWALCRGDAAEWKLKNLGEGEAGTGYALLSDVADRVKIRKKDDGKVYDVATIEFNQNGMINHIRIIVWFDTGGHDGCIEFDFPLLRSDEFEIIAWPLPKLADQQ